jgi:hypothetical protein
MAVECQIQKQIIKEIQHAYSSKNRLSDFDYQVTV